MNSLLLAVTVASLGLAAVASVVAWRVLRRERLRSSARVAGLMAEIDEDLALDEPMDTPPAHEDSPVSTGLFSDPDAATRSRAPIAVAAGALIVGAVIVLAIVVSGAANPSASALTSAASESAPVPLELTALSSEREPDALVVRGVVRNPANGKDIAGLTAAVTIFDTAGGIVKTASADVATAGLHPGDEAPFLIQISDVTAAARYRVGFKAGGSAIPHVDKRNGA